MHRGLFLFFFAVLMTGLKAASQGRLAPFADTVRPAVRLLPLPQNFYKQGLSFFCKQELRLQKLTSLPLYIRMGSKDDVDYLERKPNAIRPH